MDGPVHKSGFTISAQATSAAEVRKSELLVVAEDTSASSAGVQKKFSGSQKSGTGSGKAKGTSVVVRSLLSSIIVRVDQHVTA
ncbi:hypothetical protein PC116_g16510 [Phytophthora cactorum]|uniref:Uncharacterized protein n=1 Tax=Phytophthora cactorum TaxID=29920 RepID=A0A8T1KF05_9STRA|nr:hypothetical protein Pcac1_g26007 [Phytophthora cactorum]KAG2898051.1 hypothetical protein PC114_g14425 [Phytophthora cactorum]KAG2931813.1 hypothetical protein PC117_g13327 [Phytophthora cactorum]KAG3176463.1 hypothetical protein C6341_g8940 [Phytophthora cactorum]KAG3195907.1 hypothetical protein PC128_g8084 [Phytophthora cactorum]